jgi:hypothetical protein
MKRRRLRWLRRLLAWLDRLEREALAMNEDGRGLA